MPVIRLKTHTLQYLMPPPGYKDALGDWHPGGPEEWSAPVECHAVPAGAAATIAYEDGSTSSYSYTIGRLPADFPALRVGTRVRLMDAECAREYCVKGFHRYQLQSKLWV